MNLDKKAIEEFQEIYREDYGINLEFSEAEKLAISFFIQMTGIYKEIPKKSFDNYQKQL